VGTNAKQAIQILIIILGFVTLGAWVATVGDPLVVGALRYGAPAAALFAGWVLFAAPRRQGKEPDHLGQMAAKYFERDGLCLAPVFAEVDGTCVLSVYFQNRYAGRAVARFAMLPHRLRNLATGGRIRWTRGTRSRRCARSSRISRKAPIS